MDLEKIGENVWGIPAQGDMRVPAVVYASDRLLDDLRRDQTLAQARNVACLPGHRADVLRHARRAPGLRLSRSAASPLSTSTRASSRRAASATTSTAACASSGPISRSGRHRRGARSSWPRSSARSRPAWARAASPSSAGPSSRRSWSRARSGPSRTATGAGTTSRGPKKRGRMRDAAADGVSDRALERGMPQLGTLGSGNHFLEIQKVDEIFDAAAARAFGLTGPGQVLVMIHCGSRGLGHQVATDYIEAMENAFGVAGLPDRELVHAPFKSAAGPALLPGDVRGGQLRLRQPPDDRPLGARTSSPGSWAARGGMDQVYDVCHNVAKVEEHDVGGRSTRLVVHRKGATRSFGPGRPEIPAAYRAVGQPVIIPGSMGTASYLLAGTADAEALSFGSTAHGAGRVMSRHEALAPLPGREDPRRPGPPGHRARVDELEGRRRRSGRGLQGRRRGRPRLARGRAGTAGRQGRSHRRDEGLTVSSRRGAGPGGPRRGRSSKGPAAPGAISSDKPFPRARPGRPRTLTVP